MGRKKLTTKEIKERIFKLVGDEYELLSEYVGAKTKVKIKHNVCNFEYMVCWNNFQRGVRCPKCSFSKGEKFIEGYLTNHNISFATQVRFSDCRYKRPLPFDFGILNKEKKVIALIEYDGEGHFIPVEYWGGEETLKEVQLRDKIKDSFCKKK